jgi:hypothetical protein
MLEASLKCRSCRTLSTRRRSTESGRPSSLALASAGYTGGAAWESAAPRPSRPAKEPRKAAAGQKEMLMPIAVKKQAKERAAKKPATRQQRKLA